MSRATAVAHPNIALIKYWGKRNLALNLPAVSSLSMTLAPWRTRTTVEWGAEHDSLLLNGDAVHGPKAQRVWSFLDRIDPHRPAVRVESDNDFPTGAGLASSASGFAALTLAATRAAGKELNLKELSALARQGSGSASRSLWGGFVHWSRGLLEDGSDSHGAPIPGVERLDPVMIVAVVDEGPKDVGSTAGMQRSAQNSPLYQAFIDDSEACIRVARSAIERADLPALGEVMERSTFAMHGVMHASTPPLIYWKPATVAAIHTVFELRKQGIGAWVTMDAGPQVKVLCARPDADRVESALSTVVPRTMRLQPGGPASVEP